MATYPPMSNDQRDAVATMLHQRDSHQHISYPSEANTIIPGNSTIMHTDFSSNPDRGESHLNFGGDAQFLMHSMAGHHQGLSLSLATRAVNVINPVIQFHHKPSILGCNNRTDGVDKDAAIATTTTTGSYPSHMGRIDVESKYLKAAQELLEEVVSVKKDSIFKTTNVRITESMENNISKENNNCESTDANLRELSSGEKQELQDKLTKLLWMLDEVDRRYRQYYHQMHIVVSSFDAVSGSGSAKPYMSLALQTISRHFRTLHDAINGQICHVRKIIGGGEDYSHSGSNDKGGIGISRLRYVDQQIRQQRALQQIGMMQPHTWRPQRGLPEASVMILRAWLFEHFLHPYPKDSDKVMLARQAGLTRSQVSNWFINARVRLWKPMIEEMYREEEANGIGDADMDSNSSSDNIVQSASTVEKSFTREEDHRITQQNMISPSSSSMINRSDGFNNPLLQNSNQAGTSNCGYYTEHQNETNDPMGIFPGAVMHSDNSHRFFGGYDVSDQLKRFGNVSGISLTLGLQQECEGGGNNMNTITEGFVPVRGKGVDSDAYNTSSFGYGGS